MAFSLVSTAQKVRGGKRRALMTVSSSRALLKLHSRSFVPLADRTPLDNDPATSDHTKRVCRAQDSCSDSLFFVVKECDRRTFVTNSNANFIPEDADFFRSIGTP